MLRCLSLLLTAVSLIDCSIDHGPFESYEIVGTFRDPRRDFLVPCSVSETCGIGGGICKNGICTCPDYHVLDGDKCVPGVLLGFPCSSNSQCSARVPQSHCFEGTCQCSKELVQHKRHLCLKPADLGQSCYSNDQCNAKQPLSFCKFIVPNGYGRCQCQPPHQATTNGCVRNSNSSVFPCTTDIGCAHLESNSRCVDGFCTCSSSHVLNSIGTRCLSANGRDLNEASVKPRPHTDFSKVTLGHTCHNDAQCQLADEESFCKNGKCECIVTGPDLCGSKLTGCYPDTFQCRTSGRCISQFLVCNGRPDCDDGSDEECDGPVCPQSTFRCGNPVGTGLTTGRCISSSGRCDGKKQCADGSDEVGCAAGNNTTCPLQTYQCGDGSCVPGYAFCNSIVSCSDSSDELSGTCRREFQPVSYCPFRCNNGRCRSTSILCSGKDGCGDGSDENKCNICKCPKPTNLRRSSPQIIASSSKWHIIQTKPKFNSQHWLFS